MGVSVVNVVNLGMFTYLGISCKYLAICLTTVLGGVSVIDSV